MLSLFHVAYEFGGRFPCELGHVPDVQLTLAAGYLELRHEATTRGTGSTDQRISNAEQIEARTEQRANAAWAARSARPVT